MNIYHRAQFKAEELKMGKRGESYSSETEEIIPKFQNDIDRLVNFNWIINYYPEEDVEEWEGDDGEKKKRVKHWSRPKFAEAEDFIKLVRPEILNNEEFWIKLLQDDDFRNELSTDYHEVFEIFYKYIPDQIKNLPVIINAIYEIKDFREDFDWLEKLEPKEREDVLLQRNNTYPGIVDFYKKWKEIGAK